MLRILATHCMMQAVYFINGTLTQKEFFHYGLASPIYTHFTSPIRPIGANCRAEMAQMHLGLENGAAQQEEDFSNVEFLD